MSNTEIIRSTDERIAALDHIAKKAKLIDPRKGATFESTISMAGAVVALKNALTPEILKPIRELAGTKLGFKTDRDNQGGYGEGTIKDFVVECAMRGVPLIGNCANIIGGNFYLTREGVTYLLNHEPGLKYEITPGLPYVKVEPHTENGVNIPGEANVTVIVKWQLGSAEPKKSEMLFVIAVNRGMKTDALQGKAFCRAAKWLLAKVTGMDSPVSEGDAVEGQDKLPAAPAPKRIEAPAKTESDKVLDAIRRKQPAVNEPPEEIPHIDDDITACM